MIDEESLWKNQYIVNNINSIIIILQILIFKKYETVVWEHDYSHSTE